MYAFLWQKLGSTNDSEDDDNILFDHNKHIEIIMYNSFENQIINWSRDDC